METYPLQGMNLEEAMRLQFHIVDCMTREFKGHETLNRGDLGVIPEFNKPITTVKAEAVIANIFDAQACMLVRGAGSSAIRLGLHSMLQPGEKILIHRAPIYSTTETSLQMLGISCIEADYNDADSVSQVLKAEPNIKAALIQYTRQKSDDVYDMQTVVETIKECADIPVLTDDNYAVMKVKQIGSQCGADLSCFSAFKLLGPEGIGVIVGKRNYIEKLVKENYSGGMQTQGFEALEVLRGFVYAPVALAIQGQVIEECKDRLCRGEIPHVKSAFIANAQSKILLVEFHNNIAKRVLEEAQKLGAAPNPIGSESKYEMVPMFYRISGTFRKMDAAMEKYMIRINPMRSGADTVMRILSQAVERVVD